jgi:hypothetical protein
MNEVQKIKCMLKFKKKTYISIFVKRARGSLVVKALGYEPEGRGFEIR